MTFVSDKFLEFTKLHPYATTINMLMSLTFPIDDILIPVTVGTIVNLVQKKKPWKKVLIFYVAVMLTVQMFYVLGYLHDAKYIPQMQNFIRSSIVKDIIEKHTYGTSDGDVRIGEMMSRVVKIPIVTTSMYERIKNYIFPFFLSFIFTSAYVIYQDRTIGLILFICGFIVIGVTVTSPVFCMEAASQQESSMAKLDDETEDVLRNLPSVYTSNKLTNEMERLRMFEKVYELKYWVSSICSSKTKITALVVLATMLILFTFNVYKRVNAGLITSGLFVTIFMTVTQWYTSLGWLSSSIKELVMDWGILSSHAKSMETTVQYDIHSTPENTVIEDDSDLQVNGIVIKDISYHIPGRLTPILDDINMTIEKGERLAIIGKVGSGKSTLLKIIARLKMPSSGDVILKTNRGDMSLLNMPINESRKLVGYVQQHPMLFNRSIYENMLYGVPNASMYSKDVIQVLIDQLGLKDAFANLKDGIDTPAGKGGSVLSGGQKQLVQMIRLLLTDPQIVIMDEVTASLDNDTKAKLLEVINILLAGKTVVFVTHDDVLMARANRKIIIDSGRIKATSKLTS